MGRIFLDYICYFSLLLCRVCDLGVMLFLKFTHGTFVKVGEFSLKVIDWGNISIHRCIFANLKSITWCPFLVRLSFPFFFVTEISFSIASLSIEPSFPDLLLVVTVVSTLVSKNKLIYYYYYMPFQFETVDSSSIF